MPRFSSTFLLRHRKKSREYFYARRNKRITRGLLVELETETVNVIAGILFRPFTLKGREPSRGRAHCEMFYGNIYMLALFFKNFYSPGFLCSSFYLLLLRSIKRLAHKTYIKWWTSFYVLLRAASCPCCVIPPVPVLDDEREFFMSKGTEF